MHKSILNLNRNLIKYNEPIISPFRYGIWERKRKRIWFFKHPIELIFEDGFIKENGSKLVTDNQIGVSQILNILDSNINRSIEVIFRINEETNMIGAEKIDWSNLYL